MGSFGQKMTKLGNFCRASHISLKIRLWENGGIKSSFEGMKDMEPSNYAQLSLFFCLLCSGALVHACRSLWNSISCIWPFSSANWVVEGVSGIQLVPYTTQVSFNSFPYHANHLLLRVQQQHLGLSLFLTCLTLSFKVI